MGECFFWYRPTRVVPDQRPLNGRCCCCLLEENLGTVVDGFASVKSSSPAHLGSPGKGPLNGCV